MKKNLNQLKIKSLLIATIACISITAFAGCTSKSNDNNKNQTEQKETTTNIKSSEGFLSMPYPEIGVDLKIPQKENESLAFDITPIFENPYDPKAKSELNIALNSPEYMEYMSTLTETDMADESKFKEINEKLSSLSATVLVISRYSEESMTKSLKELTGVDNAKEIGKQDGYVYVAYEPQIDPSKFDEKLKTLYMEQKDNISKIKDNIELIPIEQITSETMEGIPSFSSKDIKGTPVTNEIFKGKKVTMINFWGTFCGPCIEEMPDLGELARELPEGSQLVGVVVDVVNGQNLDLAKEILNKAKAEFTNILPDQALIDYSSTLAGVPTTIFVDQNGNVLKTLIGSMPKEEYKKAIEDLLK